MPTKALYAFCENEARDFSHQELIAENARRVRRSKGKLGSGEMGVRYLHRELLEAGTAPLARVEDGPRFVRGWKIFPARN